MRACSRVHISYSINRLATRVFAPKRGWRTVVFGQQLGQHNRGIEIDHRRFYHQLIQREGLGVVQPVPGRGGSLASSTGGVNQPLRTASARRTSARIGLLVSRGGPISATTRSRSVTRTVSPDAASRTYSLQTAVEHFDSNRFHALHGSYQ